MGNEFIKLEQLGNNEALKKLWYQSNVGGARGDDKLEGDEITVFKYYVYAEGLQDSSEYKALGLELSTVEKSDDAKENAAAKETTTTSNPQDRPYTKSDLGKAEKNLLQHLKEEVDTDPADVLSVITDKLDKKAEEPAYKEVMATASKVKDSIDKFGYKNKKDVESLEGKVKKDLKLGRKDKFAKNILKAFVKNAEMKQKAIEFDEMKKTYDALVKDGKNREEAFNEIKNTYNQKGSYYHYFLKGANFGYKLIHWKGKMSKFEQAVIMKDESSDALNAIVQSDSKSKKDVIKDAKETIGENKTKYTNRAFKSSGVQTVAKLQGLHNTVEERAEETLTEKDIRKKVKDDVLFERLLSTGLIKKTENGYDISLLSEVVQDYVGGDLTLSKQIKEFNAVAEKSQLMQVLNVGSEKYGFKGLDYDKLNDGMVRGLVELCEAKVEKNNALKAISKKVLPFMAAGAGGAMAGLPANVRNYNKTEINIKLSDGANIGDIQSAVGDAATVIEYTGGVKILVDTAQIINLLRQAPQYVLCAAGKGAIIGAAITLLTGFDDKKIEAPITSLQFDCTTYDKYEKQIKEQVRQKTITPELAETLLTIAKAYIIDEKTLEMDCVGFKDLLDRGAGKGTGILNKTELYGALREVKENELKKEPEKDNNVNPDDNVDPDNNVEPEKHNYAINQKDEVPAEYKDVPVIDGRKTGWKEIAYTYDCLVQRYGIDKAIRIIKIAQAINNGDYSVENIEKLLEKSYERKDYRQMQGIDGFDFEAYKSAYKGDFLLAIQYDSNGNAIPGTGVKVPTELAGCERDPEKKVKVNYKKKQGTINSPTRNAHDRRKVRDGEAAEYYARFDGGKVQTYTSMKDRDDAVKNFKDKYKNAQVEKW